MKKIKEVRHKFHITEVVSSLLIYEGEWKTAVGVLLIHKQKTFCGNDEVRIIVCTLQCPLVASMGPF